MGFLPDDAKTVFSQAEGVKKLLQKAEEILDKDSAELNELICPACSCIQNLIADNGGLFSSNWNERIFWSTV